MSGGGGGEGVQSQILKQMIKWFVFLKNIIMPNS